jgi:NADH-quinone oxidoreductase subunit F
MMLSEPIRSEIQKWMALYPAGRQRSAILPALYVIQREFGYCPVDAQNELAGMLDLEPAEVGAVVDFYHMLHTEPKGEYHVEVCTNVPCMLRGAGQCMHHFEEELGIHHGQTTADDQFSLDHMECLGSCGTAPMVSVTERKSGQIRYFEELDSAEDVAKVLDLVKSGKGFQTLERWTPEGDPTLEGKPAGPYRLGGMDEPVLIARMRKPESHKIATYIADGGYETARRVLTTMKPEEVVEQVKASGIRGRGGAGFPTGMKWGFLAPAMPRYLVVNADESEPGTFKDRMIMEYDPHQLIEGIILSSYAIKAEVAFIYIRGEYYFGYTRLVEAVKEAQKQGFLGEKIFGTDANLRIVVHRGAGAYECGEETALLTSLEGYRGHPRMKPPFPAVEGLYAKPTIVNNVESIANVTHVMQRGVEWYRTFGTEKSPGMRIFCLSGNVKYPGLYELPHATSLRDLIYKYGGGPQDESAAIKAIVPGGLSMKLLTADQLDTPLDYEAVQAAGSLLGSAGVVAIDSTSVDDARWRGARSASIARRAAASVRPAAKAPAGWRTSSSVWKNGGGRVKDIDLLGRITTFIAGKSFCPFGEASVWGLQSNLAKYRAEFEQVHRPDQSREFEPPVIPIRPIYRPDTGQPSVATDSAFKLEGESPLNRDTWMVMTED